MKVAELVLDYDIYPRANVDSANVTRLREAMKAGAELPPVIIDKKSKRVVDGFHRVKAALAENGPDAEIEVRARIYKDERLLFLDAVRLNAGHGAKLDTHDTAHALILGERLKIDQADLAAALSITVDKAAKIRVDRSALRGGLHVPIKNTVRHLRGRPLTKKQARAMPKVGGMNQLFYVNQIITLIENDLLDTKNEQLAERLTHLKSLL